MRNMTEKDLKDIRENFPLADCLLAPQLEVSSEAARAFDAAIDTALAREPGAEIEYHLPYPKYLFLDYLAEKRGMILHGSLHRHLATLEPIRDTRDASEFGDQPAIYATQDPLWALFFAILDRDQLQGFIHNGAIWLKGTMGQSSGAITTVSTSRPCAKTRGSPAQYTFCQGTNLSQTPPRKA